MKISINSPSYMRPEGVDTLKYLPEAQVWVCESESDAYKKANPKAKIISCKRGIQGNKCRILNHILDTEFKKKIDAVAILDDDIQYFGYHQNKKRVKMEPKYFRAWLIKHTFLAQEVGVKLWGVNLNQDKQSYREYTPFSFTSVILGPFMVHLKHSCRFDERFPTKDDYDMSIQILNKYRRILRLNKFFYVCKMAGSGSGQTGGHARIRNMHNEMIQVVGLQKKWGRRIVGLDQGKSRSHSTRKKRNFDINPIIHIPIRGV